MLKRALLFVPLLLLVGAACTSGDGDKSAADEAASPSAAATATPSAEGTPAGPTFNPLGLLTGSVLGGRLAGQEGPGFELAEGEVDPALKAALLKPEDLPAGYAAFGGSEFNFSVPTAGGEKMQMAMAMFLESTLIAGSPGSMVVSMAVALPEEEAAEALDRFDEAADLGDLEEQLGAAEGMGMRFEDVRVLDASGLGEKGFGMHMVMDFEGPLLGQGERPNPFAGGMAFDMYMFLRDGRMYMLGVIWSADSDTSLDGRALAEVMDGRAQEAS